MARKRWPHPPTQPRGGDTTTHHNTNTQGPEPLPNPPAQALRDEPHDHDQQTAVDDEVDAHEPAPDVAEDGPEVGLERRDEDGADEGPHGRADAADDGVERETDREVDGENVEGVDEAHVLRP